MHVRIILLEAIFVLKCFAADNLRQNAVMHFMQIMHRQYFQPRASPPTLCRWNNRLVARTTPLNLSSLPVSPRRNRKTKKGYLGISSSYQSRHHRRKVGGGQSLMQTRNDWQTSYVAGAG